MMITSRTDLVMHGKANDHLLRKLCELGNSEECTAGCSSCFFFCQIVKIVSRGMWPRKIFDYILWQCTV